MLRLAANMQDLVAASDSMKAALEGGGMQLACSTAAILPNFARLPSALLQPGGLCLTVEVKPKCGFLPQSAAIHPLRHTKRLVSRYRRHQQLKQLQVLLSLWPHSTVVNGMTTWWYML